MSVPAKRTLPEDLIIGRNIRAMRIARGISQEAVAHACGVTFQQQQKIENGKNRVPSGRLVLICKVLNCSLEEIFAGTDIGGNASSTPAISAQAMRLALLFDAISEQTVRGHISGLVKSLSSNKKEHADA